MNVSKKGFTLVELLVVVTIMGVLAGVLVTGLNPLTQFQKTRDTQRKHDLAEIKKALRMYYNDNNSLYPASLPAWGSEFSLGEMIYMKILPGDPTESQTYSYQQQALGQDFCLWASLENKSDSGIVESQGRCSNCMVGDTTTDYVVCAD